MGFRQELREAGTWLASVQRDDNGWGLTPGQASSIVNTSEALYVLTRSPDNHQEVTSRGISFISNNLKPLLEDRGPRIRYVAFALRALTDTSAFEDPDLQSFCINWLLNARNDSGGWGDEANDNDPHLLPTFLALWALKTTSLDDDRLKTSLQWVRATAKPDGWSLINEDPTPTPVATAYGILSLTGTQYDNDELLDKAESLLLQTQRWGAHEEVVSGTLWKHCTYAWVIPALLSRGYDPYIPTIADGVRYVNSVRHSDGGWLEGGGQKGRTVRAQFWATYSFSHLQTHFDPQKHVPRIDAERSEATLKEPEFVKIAVQTDWATVVPQRLYRLIVLLLIGGSVAILFGMHKLLAHSLGNRGDAMIAAGLLGVSCYLIEKRPQHFGLVARYTEVAIAILAGLSILFGLDVLGLLAAVQKLL